MAQQRSCAFLSPYQTNCSLLSPSRERSRYFNLVANPDVVVERGSEKYAAKAILTKLKFPSKLGQF